VQRKYCTVRQTFTAIIGGAKVSDKILIIENLLERATDIIIGGGLGIYIHGKQKAERLVFFV